jgi:hypothetical protein
MYIGVMGKGGFSITRISWVLFVVLLDYGEETLFLFLPGIGLDYHTLDPGIISSNQLYNYYLRF